MAKCDFTQLCKLVVVIYAVLVGQVRSADYISRSELRQVIREELGSLGRRDGRGGGGGGGGGVQVDSQLKPMMNLILQHVQELSRRTSSSGDRGPSFVQALENRLDTFTRQLDSKSTYQERLCSTLTSDLHDVKTKVDFLMALMRDSGGRGGGQEAHGGRDSQNSLVPRGRGFPLENPRDSYVPNRPHPTPAPSYNRDPPREEDPQRRRTLRPYYPWTTTTAPRRRERDHHQDPSSSQRRYPQEYPRRPERRPPNPQPRPERRPPNPQPRPERRPPNPQPRPERRPPNPQPRPERRPPNPQPRPERRPPNPYDPYQPRDRDWDWGVTAAPPPTRPTPAVSIYRRMPGQCPSYLSEITGSEVFRKARDSMIGVWMKDTGVSGDTVWAVENANALHWNSLNEYHNEDDFRRRKVATLHQLTTPCSGLGAVIYKGDLFCQSHGRETRSLQIMRYSLRDKRAIARSSISSRIGGQVRHPYRGWAGVYLHLQLAVDEMGLHAIFGEGDQKSLAIFRLDANSLQTLETWRTEKPKDMIGPAFMICGVLYALDSHYAGHISYAYDTKTLQEKIIPSNRIPVPIKDMSSIHYNPMDQKLYAWTMTRPKNHHHGSYGKRIYGVAERVTLDLSGRSFMRLG